MTATSLIHHPSALIIDHLVKSVPKLNGRHQAHDEPVACNSLSVLVRGSTEADHDPSKDDGFFRDEINKFHGFIFDAAAFLVHGLHLSHKLNSIYHEYSQWARLLEAVVDGSSTLNGRKAVAA
jgi:hypothetical protein